MFSQTFKSTFKNVMRSPLFRLITVTAFGLVFYFVSQAHFSEYDPRTGGQIFDTDPAWRYDFDRYIVNTTQICYAQLFRYVIPIFTAVTTALIAIRDHGDNFYEIEKAGGVKPAAYFLGRISALFLISSTVMLLTSMLYFHLYTATRGMVSGMTLGEYLADSTVRLMRVIVFVGLPLVMFYVTLTYMIGCLFHSGAASAIGSITFAVVHWFCFLYLQFRIPDSVMRYAPPTGKVIMNYFYKYGLRGMEQHLNNFNITFEKVLAAFGIMTGCILLFGTVAYLCTSKRTK